MESPTNSTQYELNVPITSVDKNGIKTITEYRENEAGQVIKNVTQIRETQCTRRIRVDEHTRATEWQFKDEAVPPHVAEVTPFEIPKKFGYISLKEERDDDYFFADLPISTMKTGNWAKRLKQREEDALIDKEEIIPEKPAPATGTYVAPGRRRAEGHEDPEDRDDKDSRTVRVSNLSQFATQPDIMELFGRCGHVERVFLARDANGIPKGFAYVTFSLRQYAENAISMLNNHGFDNLLIKVDWAKPSPNRQG